jgi:hypothetical protein
LLSLRTPASHSVQRAGIELCRAIRVVEFPGLEQRRHSSNGGVVYFVRAASHRAGFTDAARPVAAAFVNLTRREGNMC